MDNGEKEIILKIDKLMLYKLSFVLNDLTRLIDQAIIKNGIKEQQDDRRENSY